MTHTPETTLPDSPSVPASREEKPRHIQEKAMMGLVLVFFLGVVILTVVPKAFTGLAMGLITTATLLAMFRFK